MLVYLNVHKRWPIYRPGGIRLVGPTLFFNIWHCDNTPPPEGQALSRQARAYEGIAVIVGNVLLGTFQIRGRLLGGLIITSPFDHVL